jgi:hypothetical protein
LAQPTYRHTPLKTAQDFCQTTVNRMVAGSNPARGASQINYLAKNLRIS